MERIEGDGFDKFPRPRSSLIADFCNKIGPKRTWALAPHMSAFGGKADIALGSSHLALTREKKLKLGTRGRLFGVIGLEGVASFELR